jgi:hypothetical protein
MVFGTGIGGRDLFLKFTPATTPCELVSKFPSSLFDQLPRRPNGAQIFEQREIYVRAGFLAGTTALPIANTDGTTVCFERSCLRTFIRCRRHEAVVGPLDPQGVEGVGEVR